MWLWSCGEAGGVGHAKPYCTPVPVTGLCKSDLLRGAVDRLGLVSGGVGHVGLGLSPHVIETDRCAAGGASFVLGQLAEQQGEGVVRQCDASARADSCHHVCSQLQ